MLISALSVILLLMSVLLLMWEKMLENTRSSVKTTKRMTSVLEKMGHSKPKRKRRQMRWCLTVRMGVMMRV